MVTLPRFYSSIPSIAAITITCTLTFAAYAQSVSETAPAAAEPKAEGASNTLDSAAHVLENFLPEAAAEATPTIVPLNTQLHPATPWPSVAQTPSDTVPLPQNLLNYSGVEISAQNLLRDDYATWASYLGSNPKVEALGLGLYKTFGCLETECDTKRSLLIVEPYAHKVFVAFVSQNKVVMRPSLMSWPDAAIPSLKQWLADATSED
ncbi:MAG: hypothetical protein DI585_04565 [Pseudomonas fluorescens]|nr:MAG: hypothetical protein DI585_04565 [Pseudomonas fluorescens]